MRVACFGPAYIILPLCIAVDYLHNIRWVKRMRHQPKIRTQQIWPRHWKYLTSTFIKRKEKNDSLLHFPLSETMLLY